MFEGVKGKPAHKPGCWVTKSIRHPSMSRFVDGNGDCKGQYPNDNNHIERKEYS